MITEALTTKRDREKKRKLWHKIVYIVDTSNISVISQRIGIEPSSDAPFLADMKNEVENKIVVADSGFDGCDNESFAIFKPIKRGGKFKSKNCSILDSSSPNPSACMEKDGSAKPSSP